jgi:hypothetical protein
MNIAYWLLLLWLNVNPYITESYSYVFRIVIKAAIVRLVAKTVSNIFV